MKSLLPFKSPWGQIYRKNTEMTKSAFSPDRGFYDSDQADPEDKKIEKQTPCGDMTLEKLFHRKVIHVMNRGTKGGRRNAYIIVEMDDDILKSQDPIDIPQFMSIRYRRMGAGKVNFYVYQKDKKTGEWDLIDVYRNQRF